MVKYGAETLTQPLEVLVAQLFVVTLEPEGSHVDAIRVPRERHYGGVYLRRPHLQHPVQTRRLTSRFRRAGGGDLPPAIVCIDEAWDATVNWINYEPDTGCPDYPFCYKQFDLTFRILDQNGCLFYGYRVRGAYTDPITGVISQGMSITWNASGTLYNGILGGYNSSRHIFTRINYTVLGQYQNAGKGIAIRK